MVTISLRSLAAGAVSVSAWLPAVSANLAPEQVVPGGGPLQTPPPNLKEPALQASPRAVTQHPHARGLLQKRDTQTCGYINGNSALSYACIYPGAQCLYNSDASAVGCCLTTSCSIYTACLPSTSSTPKFDTERTRYCSDSKYPHCAVLSYADPTNSLSGYTIPTCDSVSTTYKFFFNSFGSNSDPTTSSSSRLVFTTPSSTSSKSDDQSSTSSTDAETTRPPGPTSSSATPEPSPGPPVGPIVGGVVGGVAALGLIGLGVFFLMRRKKQNPTTPPPAPAPAPAPGPGFMPPPGQGPFPNQTPPPGQGAYPNLTPSPDMTVVGGAAGAYDPRYSMAKPPISPVTVSPAASPPPIYHNQMQPMPPPVGMGTPPPHLAMGTPPQGYYAPPQNGQFAPYPGPQMHQQQQPPPAPQQQQPYHGATELPTQRGDGQVHELS